MNALFQDLNEFTVRMDAAVHMYDFETTRSTLLYGIEQWDEIYVKCMTHCQSVVDQMAPKIDQLSKYYDHAMKRGNWEMASEIRCAIVMALHLIADDMKESRAMIEDFEMTVFEMPHDELYAMAIKTPWILTEGSVPVH